MVAACCFHFPPAPLSAPSRSSLWFFRVVVVVVVGGGGGGGVTFWSAGGETWWLLARVDSAPLTKVEKTLGWRGPCRVRAVSLTWSRPRCWLPALETVLVALPAAAVEQEAAGRSDSLGLLSSSSWEVAGSLDPEKKSLDLGK